MVELIREGAELLRERLHPSRHALGVGRNAGHRLLQPFLTALEDALLLQNGTEGRVHVLLMLHHFGVQRGGLFSIDLDVLLESDLLILHGIDLAAAHRETGQTKDHKEGKSRFQY